jgi:hypothetical protein
MALTDKEIQALQPREKRYKVTDGDGLYLLVNPAGGKYWYMKYYLGGRPQEVVFGVYPRCPWRALSNTVCNAFLLRAALMRMSFIGL